MVPRVFDDSIISFDSQSAPSVPSSIACPAILVDHWSRRPLAGDEGKCMGDWGNRGLVDCCA